MNDIKIKQNDVKFKFRVAGIVKVDNKILVVKMDNNQFFCFPGGHVELLEDTRKALERELSEELYFKVIIKELLFVHENFFSEKGCKFHEICFYYLVEANKTNLNILNTEKIEFDKEKVVHHFFKWLSIEDLNKEIVQPAFIVEKLLGNEKFKHFISYDN